MFVTFHAIILKVKRSESRKKCWPKTDFDTK